MSRVLDRLARVSSSRVVPAGCKPDHALRVIPAYGVLMHQQNAAFSPEPEMKHSLSGITVLLACLVALPATATASRAQRLAQFQKFAGAPVAQIRYFHLDGFETLSDDTIAVWTGVNRVYLSSSAFALNSTTPTPSASAALLPISSRSASARSMSAGAGAWWSPYARSTTRPCSVPERLRTRSPGPRNADDCNFCRWRTAPDCPY